MTELTIIPKVADKTARFKGTIAAGEHVAVTIKGGAEWIGADSGANLTLRVLDLVTGRTLAVFPYWTEDNSEDWPDDVTSADAWETSGDDNADLSCELNLNTLRMVAAARHMLRVPVMFVLGDTDDPRTLYFRDRYEVEYWPERIGDTVPYDLDKWPKKIDEWTELVAGWTARLNGLKLEAERTEAVGTTPGKTKLTLNDGTAEEDTVVEILDGQVSADQLASAVSELEDEIDDKQDALTFDDAPTADSANPVKSGGVKTAIDTVATNLSTHTGNSGIHVTADQKSAWTAKYDKPGGGIPKTDLASGVQTSLGLADTALQSHQDISGKVNSSDLFSDGKIKSSLLPSYVDDVEEYSSTSAFPATGETSKIYVAKDTNKVYRWGGSGYVEISPAPDLSAYAKTADLATVATSGSYNDLSNKPTIPSVDATLTTTGAAADAKAVGDALAGKLNGAAAYPAWDASRADYLDGDVVSWHGKLWKADEDILEQVGPPDGEGAAYWDETTLDALKQAALSSAQLAAVNSGATAAKVATWDGYAAQIAQKASTSDLRYRLVEPGVWEFSGDMFGFTDLSVYYDSVAGQWFLDYEQDGFPGQSDGVPGDGTELSVTFGHGDESWHITATRPSLPGHLHDRAGNRMEVSGDTTLTLPAAVPGYLRDFIVRLEISGSTVPTITFAAPTGETITYETDGDEFPVPDEAGTWLYSFTESDTSTFAVSLKKVNTVTQGGS